MLWLGLMLAGWLLGAWPAAQAQGGRAPLRLDDAADQVDAWPAVRVLPDTLQRWGIHEVLQRAADFSLPQVPAANFGVRREAMWLQLPVVAGSPDPRWVLQLDYAPLNKVEVWQVSDGEVVLNKTLGNAQPFAQRPMGSRAHALALDLPAGQQHVLYLRIQTESSMLVPISLYRPGAFLAQESRMQLWHGLMAGLMLAMLLYSLGYWLSLKDVLFLQYAVMLLGVGTFFIAYFGIGQQYLWPDNDGLFPTIAPLGILLALVAGSLFVRGALQTRADSRWLHPVLGGVAAVAVLALVASVTGVIGYRQTQLCATALGPVPMLLAVSQAWRQAARGDRVGRFMLLGWLVYTTGAFTAAGLLRGVLPANVWTQHLFQLASLLEMIVWLRVLGVRIELVRRSAERNELEKQALMSLAHTDALTGLPNRRGLNLALDRALQQCRADSALAVFLLDLDGFKPVNDRLGHDMGDELLVQVGQRLKQQLRASDVVARLGGDEFVIMAPSLADEADAQRLGSKLLRAFDAPFMVSGQVCRVGLTIGFALAPQDGLEPGDLLKRADAAMYAGKQAGRHCIRRGGASAGLVSG